LLKHATRVTNNIELTLKPLFYIVSGSNMSGKSALLRATFASQISGGLKERSSAA
jgi:DNA mismatch repair ATPase MutS